VTGFPELNLPFRFEDALPTDRLRLRMMSEADVDAVHAYQSRADVCRYLLFEPRDRRAVAEWVAQHARHATLEHDGDYLQLAVERRSDGRVIGDIYFTLKKIEHACAEIGWTFHPDHHGQGYATEAATAALRLGFETIGLHRIVAELDPRNAASIALCHRLGMREEAYFVDEMWFKGAWADTGVYALRAPEWRTRHDAE
jgi:RimJ/RimL family protein N-acetyltransferase